MGLIDYITFAWAIFLLVLGLIFEASGFGILVAGRLDGFILIIIGVSMFWGGWIMSGAREFSCAVAAVLNMFDAASTVAFWNFEINPIVLAAGSPMFMISKVASSLTIMLYAKLHANPRRGGIVLAAFFRVHRRVESKSTFNCLFELRTLCLWNSARSFFQLCSVSNSSVCALQKRNGCAQT